MAAAWSLAAIIAAGPAVGCKPKDDSKAPCEEPPKIQTLIQASDQLNIGEGGESWPTTLLIYQLSGATALDQPFDPVVFDGPDDVKMFGDEFVDKRELVAYPATNEAQIVSLKPKTTHLVVVAKFREKLGSAWYTSMTVPGGTRDAQCDAQRAGNEPPMPCLYVQIERSELAGGAFQPSGFDLSVFEVECAAPTAAKKKPPKKKKGGLPKVPKTPQVPKTPNMPSTPQTPTTPSAPKLPSVGKPSAPTAPKLPGR
jgi:type VI secretion system VasD/TssJ family lipoprotein